MTEENNAVIFERAKDMFIKLFGELTDEDIKDIRSSIFRPSWKKEGKWFLKMRTKMKKSLAEIAGELNIKEAQLKKLEKGNDFKQRDITAQFLENYYKLRIK